MNFYVPLQVSVLMLTPHQDVRGGAEPSKPAKSVVNAVKQ